MPRLLNRCIRSVDVHTIAMTIHDIRNYNYSSSPVIYATSTAHQFPRVQPRPPVLCLQVSLPGQRTVSREPRPSTTSRARPVDPHIDQDLCDGAGGAGRLATPPAEIGGQLNTGQMLSGQRLSGNSQLRQQYPLTRCIRKW